MKIALIGCGAAADRYYVPAIKKNINQFEEIYLVDLNHKQAESIRNGIGQGKIVNDFKEIIGEIDGAIITLPNSLHHPVGMALLEAGVHVLCEKPLADTFQDAQEMVAAAETHSAKLCVNNTRRMFPSHQAIRKDLAEKKIGRIKKISYTEGSVFGWASATNFYVDPKLSSKGILFDLGPHAIDTICWWLNEPIELLEYCDDSFGGPESVINIVARSGDIDVEIFLNRLADLDSEYSIQGELGKINGKPVDWRDYKIKDNRGEKRQELKCEFKNYPAFVIPIVQNFFEVIKGNTMPLVEGKDVLPSIRLIDQCYSNRKRFSLPWYDQVKKKMNPDNRRVLITGATGFVGGSIVEQFYLSGQRNVKAAVHSWSNAARIGRFPIDLVKMDLMDTSSIRSALEDVDEIIHCAKGDYEVTVDGTENLLSIAKEKDIKKIVYMSTADVYGDREGDIDETAPLAYTGNEYNRMKIDAEKVCQSFIKEGLPIIILRPSIIYGPFSRNWTVHFSKLLQERKIGVLEEIGEGICNLIYIDDLVSFIALCLENDNPIGEIYNVAINEKITWNQYLTDFNNALNLSPIAHVNKQKATFKTAMLTPVRKVGAIVRDHFMEPVKMVAENVSYVDSLLRKLEKTIKTTPASDELKLFSKSARYENNKASNLLNYQPAIKLSEGLSLSADWLEHHKIICTQSK